MLGFSFALPFEPDCHCEEMAEEMYQKEASRDIYNTYCDMT